MGGIECVEVLGAAISGTPLAHESREPWGLAEHVVRCGGTRADAHRGAQGGDRISPAPKLK